MLYILYMHHISEPTQVKKTYIIILYCLQLLYDMVDIIGIAIIMKQHCTALQSLWSSSNCTFYTGEWWCPTTVGIHTISRYKLNIYLLLHFCCFVYTEIGLRSCKGRIPKHIYGFLLSRLKQSQQ